MNTVGAVSTPDLTVLQLPYFHADPERDSTHSDVFGIIRFERRMVLIGGTQSALTGVELSRPHTRSRLWAHGTLAHGELCGESFIRAQRLLRSACGVGAPIPAAS